MKQWHAALALVAVLTACQDQPTAAVPDSDPLYAGQAVPATTFTVPVDFQDVPLCGVDIADAVGTFHRTTRRVEDPETGRGHFVRVDHYSLEFVGRSTGWVWRWNETIVRSDQYAEDGTDAWMRLNDHATVVGIGQAPNFDIDILMHLTVNANGDVTADYQRSEATCGS